MEKVKRIVFVSEMRNPKTHASSTQIMTRNLLYGFNMLCDELIYVAVVENLADSTDIESYYAGLFSHIYFVKEQARHKNNIVLRQLCWLWDVYFPSRYREPSEIFQYLDTETILISQSPGIDAALICKNIKARRPNTYYVQYWGDPLALSLITPRELTYKRLFLKLVEQRLHLFADRIVYGTHSLYKAQIEIFPEITDKTSACGVCYMPDSIQRPRNDRMRLFGYFGNYYSSIRNLLPLYDAFSELENADLVICGLSDCELKEKSNIRILQRIPQSEVEEEEAKVDIEVCVLNRKGIQIPGKLFYHTNTEKHILVLKDGPVKDDVSAELSKSERFIFCENNKEDIKNVVKRILRGEFDRAVYTSDDFCPQKVCSEIIGQV